MPYHDDPSNTHVRFDDTTLDDNLARSGTRSQMLPKRRLGERKARTAEKASNLLQDAMSVASMEGPSGLIYARRRQRQAYSAIRDQG